MGLDHHHHRITIDRGITLEESAKMLDVTDANHPTLQLFGGDHTTADERLADRRFVGPLGVVHDATVQIHPNLGHEPEGDLAGEGVMARHVERQYRGGRIADRRFGELRERTRVQHRVNR